MLRMGKMTDYATVVLAALADDPARQCAAADLAERTHLTQPTVSKVLKGLQRAGMVHSARGTRGGYRLARRPDEITAAEILDVFEGPIAITECSAAASQCGIEKRCRLGTAWQRINQAIRRELEDVTLHELLAPEPPTLRGGSLATRIRIVAARL